MVDNKSWLDACRPFSAALLGVGLLVPAAGCGAAGGPRNPVAAMRELPSQLVPGQKDAALRKKVEDDKFPTAQEAGVQ